MKIFSVNVILFFLFAMPVFATDENSVVKIPAGSLELFAITDCNGKMAKNLLPDIGKYPEMDRYFKEDVLPSVTRIFYLQTGGKHILFDSGWGKHQKAESRAVELLKQEKIEPEKITDIFLTHLDQDHIGGMIENGKAVFKNADIWVAKPEYEAWTSGKISKRGDKAKQLVNTLLSIYKDKIHLFEFDKMLMPGIMAIDASGHTPGHTVYEINSLDGKFLIAGDIAHLAPVQLLRPDLSSVYDMDEEKAATARKNILDKAAKDKIQTGAMHMPSISKVYKIPNAGYLMRDND